MCQDDDSLAVRGTMGAPVYWDYSVALKEDDVVDFLKFLQQPAVVRYMITAENRWSILLTALQGAGLFAWRIVCLLLGVASSGPAAAPAVEVPAKLRSETSADVLEKLPEDIARELQEAERDD
jgi:hypothetical protein